MHGESAGAGAGGSSKLSENDRKHINDVLDKHFDRTTSKRGPNPKSKRCSDEESDTDSEESDVSGSDGEDTSWISWFCSLRGKEFFCEVDDDYIQDDFNLCGLSSQVPCYDCALDLILDAESSHGDMFTQEQNELIVSAAEMLYVREVREP